MRRESMEIRQYIEQGLAAVFSKLSKIRDGRGNEELVTDQNSNFDRGVGFFSNISFFATTLPFSLFSTKLPVRFQNAPLRFPS
jgi:hypothetical protein